MIFFKKTVFLILFMLAAKTVHAGMVEGPHLIWINLAPSPESSNSILREFLSNDQKLCWDDGLLLFMSERPPAITNDLVYDAVIKKSRNSIDKLNSLLKMPFKEATDGFDGIVVYAEYKKPMLYSLTTGRKNIQMDNVARPLHIKGAFCNVIPPTVRKP